MDTAQVAFKLGQMGGTLARAKHLFEEIHIKPVKDVDLMGAFDALDKCQDILMELMALIDDKLTDREGKQFSRAFTDGHTIKEG